MFDTEVRENLFATTRKPTVKTHGRFCSLGGNIEISRFQYHIEKRKRLFQNM